MGEQQCIVHREAASIATFDVARHIFFLIFSLSLSPFFSLQPVVLFETRFEQLKILASRTPSATTSRKIEPPLLAHEKESNDITRLGVTLYYNSTSPLSSNNTKFLKTLTLSLPFPKLKEKRSRGETFHHISQRSISPIKSFTRIALHLSQKRGNRGGENLCHLSFKKKIPSNEILLSTERDVTTSPSFSVCRLKWRFNQRRGIITSGIRVSLSLFPPPPPFPRLFTQRPARCL